MAIGGGGHASSSALDSTGSTSSAAAPVASDSGADSSTSQDARRGRREVGVEVDGPSQFAGRTPTGATALKRRQLRAAGWALVSVPYWEWDALKVKPEHKGEEVTSWQLAQREYLSERLEQIVPGWAV